MARTLPPLGQLEAFEATARLGSVSQAAAELSLTQGTVSKMIIALEARLGVDLFLRRSRRLLLTEAGGGYLAEVRPHLAGLASATAGIIAQRQPTTLLQVATLPTFGAKWLMPRLPRFRAAYPAIRISLTSRPEPFDFSFELCDCAIHFGSADWPGAVTEFLCAETMMAVAVPARAERIASFADLAGQPLLATSSRPFAWREWLAASDEAMHGDFRPEITVDNFAMALEAVKAGMAIAVLPHFLIEEELAADRLRVILGATATSLSAYYFVYPDASQKNPAVTAFGGWLRGEVLRSGAPDQAASQRTSPSMRA